MNSVEKISRRRFLELTGISTGGLLLGGLISGSNTVASVLDEAVGNQLTIFVSVQSSGLVEIIAHRSEMGTGIRTGLPQVVADEMGADWSRVTVIQGLANADYGSQNTDGSRSVRDFYTVMRQMGASARLMLEQAAARSWGVPVADCRAGDHRVYHKDGRALGFGELAEAAARFPLPDVTKLTLKSPGEFNYIGKDVPIVDLEDMTSGKAIYGVDVHLPGMLYASIERTPVLDGRVESLDDSAARKVSGVVDVVQIKGKPLPAKFNPIEGVAVVASNTWSAMKGRVALEIKWKKNERGKHNSDSYLDALMEDVSSNAGEVARERGDVDGAMARSARQVTATYRTPYLAHASMEPPMATASLHDGICEVWACTQTPQTAQREVAKALGLDKAEVKVHVTLLGGGFGRKSKPDYIVEAALLARQLGKPVQVVWTREDDIRHDYFHSCSAQYYRAGLDDSGKVTAWLAREAMPPIGSTFVAGENLMSDGALSQSYGSIPFAIPNLRLERNKADAHARIGWMRSVHNIPFGFGIGSFVDELAHAADKDPRDFLLELIGKDRHLDFAPEGFEFSNYGKPIKDYPYDTARLKNVIREVTGRIP